MTCANIVFTGVLMLLRERAVTAATGSHKARARERGLERLHPPSSHHPPTRIASPQQSGNTTQAETYQERGRGKYRQFRGYSLGGSRLGIILRQLHMLRVAEIRFPE
jgi:hypothetical protein